MTLARLVPKATLTDLHPPGTAFAPRSSIERTRWVLRDPTSLDAITGFAISVLGPMPLVCHREAATAKALEFVRRSGLDTPSDMRCYESEAEAVALARALVAEGRRLAYVYPPPHGADDPAQLVVPVELYGALNDKASLADFIAPEHLARREIMALDAARVAAPWPADKPVFVKVSHAGACGGGVDVRYCASAQDWQAALEEFAANEPAGLRLVVEEAIDIHTCWCLSLAVIADEIRYLGAAIQLFEKPGQQSGSLIDPTQSAPEAAIRIAIDAVEKGRRRGYQGIAGVDIGEDAQGRLYVFDLNFRINGSTPQVLLHEAATARVGARVSCSFDATVSGRLGPALDRLQSFAEEGRFVPIRLHEFTTLGKSRITGMVVEHSTEAAGRLAVELAGVLAGGSG